MDSTLAYYTNSAQEYFDITKDVKLEQSWDKFTKNLKPGATILDLGCGSGRDLKHFAELGFRPVGVDYSRDLCRLARKYSHQQVICADIRNLSILPCSFDAIWSIGTLHHLTEPELRTVFCSLKNILKPDGLLFFSLKGGLGEMTDRSGRYFAYYTNDSIARLLLDSGFAMIASEQVEDSMKRTENRVPTQWIDFSAIARKEQRSYER